MSLPAALFEADVIEVVCHRPAGLEDHPDLALRLRGALGQALAERVAALPPEPLGRSDAFTALFAGEGDAARPMAVSVDVSGEALIARVSLFGGAGWWVRRVEEALVAALAGGVALRTNGRRRVPLEPLEARWLRRTPRAMPETAGRAALVFLTPVRVRRGDAVVGDPAAILWSAVTRVRDLLPWQGLAEGPDLAALRAECAALRLDADAMTPFRAHRHSRRVPGQRIPADGFLGPLVLEGRLSAMLPILAIGEMTHIGSHAALGFGRYRLSVYP